MPSALVMSAKGVGKIFSDGQQKIKVLSDLNFELCSGEWVAILGASGSGKSTLLNLLGGLDVPTTGQIFVSGKSMAQMNDEQRSVWRNKELGFVFQMHHLLPEFSALENAAMPARIKGLNKTNANNKAASILEQLGLAARMSHRPAALSGGERQRVAIARALVNSPSCILMDEPTGNLDPETAEQVIVAMESLRGEKTSFVVVTHDPHIASKMDRKWKLSAGRLKPV